ncbi:hypothetical protein [Hwanghaeella sp.]|uniref:hypothetical protein n=1 Tax=Hwanghaeella sp. TaxID=2605943 RepID=UPI003CCB860B
MTKALLFTGESGQFRYYREVIARLKHEGVQVALCCDRGDPGIRELMADASRELEVPFYYHDGDSELPMMTRQEKLYEKLFFFRLRFLTRFRKCIGHLPRAALFHMIRFHRYRLSAAKKIIRESGADIIVVPEDGIGGNYWAVEAAARLGVPSAVLPFGMGDSSSLIYKGIEEKFSDGSLCLADSEEGAVIKEIWPQWVNDTAYGEALFLPPAFVAGMELTGISLPQPWVMHGGNASAILVEGTEMQSRYRKEGVREGKMVLAGSVYTDILHDGLMRFSGDDRVIREFRRHAPDNLRVLVCVPPNESSHWRQQSEFEHISDYCTRLRHFAEELGNVTLDFSLHPRTLPQDIEILERNGIRGLPDSAIKLIPAYDVVITSLSSVSRWALVCARPVIDFDMFGFKKIDFPDVAGFLYCLRFGEVLAQLKRLHDDDQYYTECSRGCLPIMQGFEPVDGKAVRNIARRLEQIVAGTANDVSQSQALDTAGSK